MVVYVVLPEEKIRRVAHLKLIELLRAKATLHYNKRIIWIDLQREHLNYPV